MASSGTFSILALSKRHKIMGVAVASGSMAVGSRVPHALPGVGVITTQAYTNVAYGVEGLKLLAGSLSPKQVLERLIAKDPQREMRQVAIMNFAGEKAVFTGTQTPEWRGEIIGEDYVVIGNLLKSRKVLESMAECFEKTGGDLAIRLLEALRAGSESGGDKRGEKSAAIIMVNANEMLLSLRVDDHRNPIEELLRMVEKTLKQQ
jgi:uncharacterized Ntn-hydrolase superfamily protein